MDRKLSKQFYQHVIILIIVLFSKSHAQVDTVWTKTFGGSTTDIGESVQQTSDGGYIVTGYTYSFGHSTSSNWNCDVWLIKTNTYGDTLWTRTFGGSDDDAGYSVQQTSEGGYIIIGYTVSFGAGSSDVWLIRTNASGDTLWTKTFGGDNRDGGYSIQQTKDNGYIITGTTESFGAGRVDIWLIKTNAVGDTLWTKTFGGKYDDCGYSVQQTFDEGFIITGDTNSFGGSYTNDVWLIKTDSLGDTLWTKTFGGSTVDASRSVQQTQDEGYIIAGWTFSYGAGHNDVWLIKTNSSGDTLWTKTFGGSEYDGSFSVQQLIDDGYIIVGNTNLVDTHYFDVWMIRTDAKGDTIWTKTFGGNCDDIGYSVRQTTDRGYIIIGYTYSIDTNNYDLIMIKTTSDMTSIETFNTSIPSEYNLTQNYPNPFNPSTTIEFDITTTGFVSLKLYNVIGQEVATLINNELPQGNHKIEWKPENLSSGLYFYKLETKGYQETKKLILMK